MSTGDKVLAILFAVILTVLIAVANARGGEIGISTGPPNLAYYAAGMDIKAACPHLNVNIYESKGGLSNIGSAFTRAEKWMLIAPYDTMMFKDRTDHGKMSKLGVLMPLYKNVIQVVASNKSGIKTVKDLKGKRGNDGPIGSGSWVSAQLIKNRLAIEWIASTDSTAVSLQKVISGELDFAFYFSGVPTPDLGALEKEVPIHLVSMSHPELERLYEPTEIPENTYAFEPNTVQALQVQNYLLAYISNDPVKQKDAEDLLACIVGKLDWLAENRSPFWRAVDKDAAIKWQLHPAAANILGKK